jgi:hypothetical protein
VQNIGTVADSQRPQSTRRHNSLFGLTGRQKWCTLIVGATALALMQAIRLYSIYNPGEEIVVPWHLAGLYSLMEWYTWMALCPIIIRITNWIGFDRTEWIRWISYHFGLALCVGILQLFIYGLQYSLLNYIYFDEAYLCFPYLFGVFTGTVKYKLFHAVLIYFLIAFASFTVNYYNRYRDEEIRSAEAEACLAQTRLESLKMQLQPHFLFNALNAITTLIHTDPEAADRMISRLSELFRIVLENKDQQLIPLRIELEMLDRYLDIQKIRFQDRLQTEKNISPDSLDSFVPNMILQPLVENAIRHGISKRTGAGEILISSDIEGPFLTLTVADNGPGLTNGYAEDQASGYGLANTRERLKQLYGDEYHFDLLDGPEAGLVVTIRIPNFVKSKIEKNLDSATDPLSIHR